MDFLDIDKEDMIKLLLDDNKINIVRDAVMSDNYSDFIKKERLNYCTDEELQKIAKDEETLLSVLLNYDPSDKLIDLIISDFIEYESAIRIFILHYMKKLNPSHLEKLIKYPRYKELISDNLESANKKSTIFLYKNDMIPMPTQEQLNDILPSKFIDADIKKLSINNICVVSYERKFTLDELEYAINRIFDTNIDLYMKGNIDCLIQSQEIPDYYLKKMVMEWDYTPDELWFERLLDCQNLDSVIDYILDNFNLKKDAIKLIITNNRTSPKKLIRLYKDYYDLIVESGSKTLPVLDCHLHMC